MATTQMKIVHIPVNYTHRVGSSSMTGNKMVAFVLGLRMIRLILKYRWHGVFTPGRFPKYTVRQRV